MCTASHNPKAYTGAKLVREGAIALSGDAGIEDIRREIEAGRRRPPGADGARGSVEEVDLYGEFQAAALRFIDPSGRRGGRPLKVVARRRQRDGGADGRAAAGGPRAGPDRDLLDARTATSPTTSPTRCCRRTGAFIIERVRDSGADLGIAWDGDADRCFFIDDTGAFVDGDFLTALLARVAARASTRGEAILYDVRASRAVPDTVRQRRRHRPTSTASATPSSRRACARRARCSAARSPVTTTSATSTARTPARSRRC